MPQEFEWHLDWWQNLLQAGVIIYTGLIKLMLLLKKLPPEIGGIFYIG